MSVVEHLTMDDAVASTRRYIFQAKTPGARLRALWAGAKHATSIATHHEVLARFTALGAEFHKQLGRHADEDVRHVVSWATHGRDPFGGNK